MLIDRLQAGTLDAAIVSVGSDEVPPGLAVEVVTDEAIEAVVSHDDPWADRTSVRLSTLVQRPLIALPVGAGIRAQLDNACAAAGLTPRIAVEASTPIALAEFAERGLGVAIVPQSVARSRAALHPIAISPALRGRLVLAWRASGPMSPAARALVAMARQLLRVGAGA